MHFRHVTDIAPDQLPSTAAALKNVRSLLLRPWIYTAYSVLGLMVALLQKAAAGEAVPDLNHLGDVETVAAGSQVMLFHARPSALEGAARILDFGNTLCEYNAPIQVEHNDLLALDNDWRAIGEDLTAVIRGGLLVSVEY